ncbi:lamin tail domain-containing protein [Patescibacteria group bacterium]|nr:MAG: lamin tail domain-containing protein [Patescibacteria group bacterium]
MHKRIVVAMLIVSSVLCGLSVKNASAVSSSLVLSQIQLGNAVSASNEFIEVYNNASTDTEVTNWCLYYASASSTQIGSKLGCFVPENDSLHLYLPTHTYAFAISTILATNIPSLGSDLKFAATLSGTAGHVRLLDNNNIEIDKVGWGTTAASPETLFTPTAPVEKVLSRKVIPLVSTLQDTDNNSLDFELLAPRSTYSYGSIYEVQDLCKNIAGIQTSIPAEYSVDVDDNCMPPPIDVCTNIDGLQITLPTGYEHDEDGLCQPDVCSNIEGLQMTIPTGKELDAVGNCVDHDYCPNISAIQITIPEGYHTSDQGVCLLSILPIKINEILANAAGSDNGNEFIELYNPNDTFVDLSVYQLKIGINAPKFYSFPAGSTVEPHGYISFSDDDIPFTLVNSTSQVSLVSSDNQLIDESPAYSNPADDMAWALINGIWQYTNQPTPGSSNIVSVDILDNVEEVVVGLQPCAPNQYRNPETNRCRLLVTVGSALVPCQDGQYRSETTNRCRSIASDAATLTLCNPNQERNPETNRCRLVASSNSEPTPCKEGQERNPDTNRCRNVVSSVPTAAFAVEPISDSSSGLIGWLAVGGVCLVALLYAGWEWREELLQLVRRLGAFFHW